MRFEYFDSLTERQAKEYLYNYLTEERASIDENIKEFEASGGIADFSTSSIPNFLKYILIKIRIEANEIDKTLPEWIRNDQQYLDGLFDFDEKSKILILRSSFYLGESFTKDFKGLKWGVGSTKTAQKNMPVVKGFKFGLEMAPMLIVENIFRKILREKCGHEPIDKAIYSWLDETPMSCSGSGRKRR
jgi:hypothetical protein